MEIENGSLLVSQLWSEVSVDDLKAPGNNALSTGPFGSSVGTQYFQTTGIPLIRGSNLAVDGRTHLVEENFVFISESKAAELQRSIVYKGDLIFTCWGTINQIGLISERATYESYVISNKQMKLTPDPRKADSLFLFYLFSGAELQSQIINQSIGSSVPGFNLGQLRALRFRIPGLSQQRAIAEVLTDVDALITALEQLIAKKRHIKQATMQELLTGQTRLPGFTAKPGYKQTPSGIFPKDWDVVPLKLISSMHGRIGWQGLKQSEFTMNADDPFLITGMNFKDGEIRWDEVYHVPWDRYEMAKEIQLKTGDVLMTKDGTIGKMLYVDEIPYPRKATLNSHLLVFRPLNNKYIPKFLFYQMNSKAFYNHIEQEKSGTTFFGITQEAVGKYNAFLPSIAEQTAIATILSDMDTEITTLETKLHKTRLLKQGMMQELLTGRIRLVERGEGRGESEKLRVESGELGVESGG